MIHKSGAQGLRFLATLKTAARLPLRCHEYQWCPAAPVISDKFPGGTSYSLVLLNWKPSIHSFLQL